MKRGSVIGPLILIGIGALFLTRNLWPDIPIADILSRYWPFVLIAWGALRLVEIFLWAIMSKPLPRNGVSAGEWMMVFLICVVGGTMYTARHYASWFPSGRALRGVVMDMGESYDYTLTTAERPCAKNCRVLIESFRGNAKVSGSADATVKVSGHETVRSFQQAEADTANKQTPLEVIQQGDELIIRTNQDRVSDRAQVSSDLEITVPAGASIEAHGRYGDFDFQNIGGSVDINSDNAGVRLENIAGNVRIDLRRSDIIRATDVKGNIDLRGRGQDLELQNIAGLVTVGGTYVGEVQLHNLAQPLRYENQQVTINCEKLPGQIHLASGELTGDNIIGPVRISARSRDVQLSDFTQSLDLTLERGDVTLRAGKTTPKIELHTAHSGDIDLAMPGDAKFDLKVATERGEVHNDFGSPLKVEETNRGGKIEGSTGGPTVRLETARGSVTVRKLTPEQMASPEPPHPPSPAAEPKPPSPPPLKVERQ